MLDRTFAAIRENEVSVKSYDLIANGCLMLASKFEELDMKVPFIIDLQIANKFKISYQMLKDI